MLRYCIKVFDSEERLKYQIIVPAQELYHHLDNLSSYGTVKAFLINDEN